MEIRFVNQSIGQHIRKIRQSKDLSQENMADELGISKGAYSKMERGITDIPLSRLLSIAKVLEVEVSEFFKTGKTISKAEDSEKNYGFATKGDIEELAHMIGKLAKEIESLKAQSLSGKEKTPAKRGGK